MPVKVVVASALVAVLFGEPEAKYRAPRQRPTDSTHAASYELANVCLVRSRRRPELRPALTAAFRLRARLCVDELLLITTARSNLLQ
jgi:uncharacterized protein with PIN domain